MAEPVIALPDGQGPGGIEGIDAAGQSFSIHEWRGSGPASLHVHYDDDEAWHVLEGSMKFRFADREIEVHAGATVFVPAGVAHTYEAADARYLIILTPRLTDLIAELHRTPDQNAHGEIYRKYRSELLD
jgi:mannose-6-phosphate isomerase-like protein (cupin superfamily)